MKLVLYGGGHSDENHSLDSRLMSLISTKKPLVTYIPSCSIYAETDFVEFAEQFQKFGVRRILNFPIDRGIDSLMMKAILQSDMIHLSGGNTYYFLKYLRQTGMLNELKKYVKSGGILTGLSAGAILMTPNVDTAGFPSFDKDENEEKVKNFKSLNLVDFHFFPHYKNSNRYDIDLLKYSQKVQSAVYAVPDGAGIIVNGNELIFHNKVYCFYQNKKMVMSSI
jgi:dipeptidase E